MSWPYSKKENQKKSMSGDDIIKPVKIKNKKEFVVRGNNCYIMPIIKKFMKLPNHQNTTFSYKNSLTKQKHSKIINVKLKIWI